MAFGRTGVAPGTYRSVQVDKYGRVVAGTSPTTVTGYGLTDVYTKTQVDDALSKKADLASPKLTGVPEAPTAEVGTSSNQLATMRALIQGLSAFGLTADKTARPADLDALRGTRFFGFTHWTVGAPAEAGPYDAVGFQIESFGQRTQFAVSSGARLQIRTDDSEDYSGFDAWTELSSVNALSALSATLTAQLELKAPLASPDFAGKPTVPTQAKGNKSKLIANTEFVQAEIAALVDSAPGSLDTLRELATALGNDPNFATTIVGELGKKANLASPKFTGTPEAPTPPVGTNNDQLATMKALLQALASFGLASGRSMFVDDLNSLRGTCFFGFGEKAIGAIESGIYDAIGFQVESVGQRTQFAVPGGSRLFVRTDDSSDASGFEPWAEMASLNAVNLLAEIVAGKASIASPKFTGTPEVPTAAKGNKSKVAANTEFVQAEIAALVDSAPGSLDTLRELATALGNDPNFATTMVNELSKKANSASPKLTGTPEAPTAPVGTNTDQLATMKGLSQALASFGITTGRSAHVSDLDNLRGTSFFGYTNVSVGAEDTGGGYDAVGFQIEAPGQRTQFGVTTGSKVAVRTDDSNDYSGFSPWLELATVDALKALEAQTVGMSAHFAMSTPPPGWLKRNGAAVSRTTYAALFAKIGTTWGAGDGSTTFNLPDGRGSFDRGWDDGRNLDKGRVFASDQGPANLAHNHVATVSTDGAHTHSMVLVRERITAPYVPEGGNAVMGDQESDGLQPFTTTSNGAHKHSVVISSTGESESRPYNSAYLACIKY
ncbi:phage tail protein [Pseudomonas putida]|uniref:phage tail protein n=1 Tax=Pseudomonas putida TaxID=303 RepID=UPI003FA30ECA